MNIGDGGCWRRWEMVGRVVAGDGERPLELGAAGSGRRWVVGLVAWSA